MFLVSPLSSRNQIGPYLNDRGLLGEAAEVGTHRGEFAGILLDSWNGRRLWCIDPWTVPEGYGVQAKYLQGGPTREDDYQEAVSSLRKYAGRARLLRETSLQSVPRFPDNCLDFVYLDGDHSYESVSQDLRIWWPKLRSGGVLAGHDIICPGPPAEDNWGVSVQPAVYWFARSLGDLHVYLIVEEGGLPWSYYMVKP